MPLMKAPFGGRGTKKCCFCCTLDPDYTCYLIGALCIIFVAFTRLSFSAFDDAINIVLAVLAFCYYFAAGICLIIGTLYMSKEAKIVYCWMMLIGIIFIIVSFVEIMVCIAYERRQSFIIKPDSKFDKNVLYCIYAIHHAFLIIFSIYTPCIVLGNLETYRMTDTERSSTENEQTGVVEVYRQESQPTLHSKNTMEIRLQHTFDKNNTDMIESEMGLTVQYLAQENARLALRNKELLRKLEIMKKERDKGEVNDIEIYGETADQRLIRLEKTLDAERREKWEAIEESEKIRVDLVNCERELTEREVDMENLRKELSVNSEIICKLKETVHRLENREGETKEILEPERVIKRETELEAFKADLAEKRQIRQGALAAISSELQKLREELDAERQLRRKLQQAQIEKTTDGTEIMESLLLENDKLRREVQTIDKELQSMNSLVSRLKSDYNEEKNKHEQTCREKKSAEEEMKEKVQLLKEMKLEKERMWADYDREKVEVNKRTIALKDVVEISRQMLVIRENQVQELKKKLKEIEESVSNSKLPDQKGLREEYEKQLQNIKTLKELYEERVRLMEVERDKLNETISQHTKTIEGQKEEIETLKEQYGATSEELKEEKSLNESLERDLRLSIARSKDFENELSLINNLFTQMLLGPYNTGNETDLDKLTELLQENHDLITELTLRENSSEIASALPKLLLDLITQVDGNGHFTQEQGQEQDLDTVSEQSDSIVENAVLPILSYKRAVVFENPDEKEQQEDKEESKPSGEPSKSSERMNPAVQEIASNLPKVWRVLMELLSHHSVPDGPPPGDEKQCYKNIETPSGTRSVISVSNTFIRLKDLILEKKSLQKELTRLKQLNSHLEGRLDDQEKRLSHVQCELHKTWGVVGRMRAQHQQLHNHERILRYELQEKRIMLSELKQELEYCRDKWERARQKNDESETQWQKLRREFAARKVKSHPQPTANLNDSGESGFSDEPNESGEEVDNFDADRSSTQSPVDGKPEALRGPSCDAEKTANTDNFVVGTSLGAIPRTQQSLNEEKLRNREARLKRLEDQCQLLVRKVDITTSKSNYLNNRLEELHEQYGSTDDKTDATPSDDGSSSSFINEDKIEEGAPAVEETEKEESRRTVEESVKGKNERVKRLEEQCQSLVGKATNTDQRGTNLSNRLEDVHFDYVSNEKASIQRRENATAVEDSTGIEATPDITPRGAPTAQNEEEKTE